MAWLVGTEAVANVFLHGDLKLNPLLPLWPHILCPRPSWSGGDPAYLTNGDSLPEQVKCTLGKILFVPLPLCSPKRISMCTTFVNQKPSFGILCMALLISKQHTENE